MSRTAPMQAGHAERVTLMDVAARAHVSRATASLVLRGSTLVAEETRRRVLAAMADLGYVYHRAAANLRTQRSQLVGLVVPDITNPFFAELTGGVEACLDAADQITVLANTAEALPKQDRVLAVLREHNADGVLLCPAEGTPTTLVAQLRAWRLPVTMLVRYLPDTEVDYAGADNARGAALAAAHLIDHGHRRIAFIGGRDASSARRDRLAGFRDALTRRGLGVDLRLTPTCQPTREAGFQAIQALLRLPDPPTAALCYNDVVAFGVLRGLQAAHRSPGVDFAVIGFDDIAEAALHQPPLTTVALSPRRIGEEAARLLHDRIARPEQPPRRTIVSPTVIVRATCGPHHGLEHLP